MNKNIIVFSMGILSAFILPCMATDTVLSPLVSDLMNQSGATNLIELLSQMGRDIGNQAKTTYNLPPDESRIINQKVDQVFSVSTMTTSVSLYVQTHLKDDDAKVVLAWLSSPLGRKITALEVAVLAPHALDSMPTIIASLKSKADSGDRSKLLERINAATGASSNAVAVTLSVEKAIQQALKAFGKPNEMPSHSDEEDRAGLYIAYATMQLDMGIFAYRSLETRELLEYVTFIESEAGMRYNKVFSDAVGEAVLHTNRQLLEVLQPLVRLHQSSSNGSRNTPVGNP